MKIMATIDTTWLEHENGRDVQGVTATCSRCDHTTESYGTSSSSRRRCLVLLRQECPRWERNFYVEEDDFYGEEADA
jgi:hypothetical protein